ncbi:MAG TPA: hypothetical protein VFE45_03745, partial [Coriobacteriia bacterium]|nr:hypothetical protein [Coriobacteriia bacterium]
ISANAEILAAEIDTLLTGSPVQEVDIVGHSMGGLDGRLYAFDNPGRVRKLLMMGTPNGGSELSNVLCGIINLPWWAWVASPGGALTAEGVKNMEDVKDFGDCDGPHNGLYQLQTPYVRNVFNVQVPDMPTVEYATIAGRGGGAGSPVLDGFMPGIAGDDDGTVSVASVRWLSQFGGEQRGLHSTLYPSIDEDHMALYRDSASLARPLALCWITKSYSECMDAGEPAGSPGLSTMSAFSEAEAGTAASAVEPTLEFQQAVGPADIVPAGVSREYVVDVAEGEFAHLVVLGGEDLEILLDSAPLKPTTVFAVGALEADLASTATLTVRNTGAQERSFLGLLFVASARALTIDVPTLAHPGEDVTVVATLTGGRAEDQPVALVTRGDEPVLELPLASVGADRWEVSFPAPPAGSYSVSAVVTGSGPRLVSAPMIVSDGGALAGSFTEVTVDQDRDGLIDALEVTVPVEVLQAGEYRLAGALVTADGRRVAAAGTTGALTAGPGSLTLSFDGREIHDAALAGPWQLVDVALSDGALNLLDVGDLGPVSHSDYRGYERDAIALDGFADEGVDADGDGLFEVLRISTEATVDTSGYYAVNAKLVTMDGVDVGRAQQTVYLQAGTTTVDLVFDGATIGATGLDGPFVLRDLAVYPTARPSAGVALVNAHV